MMITNELAKSAVEMNAIFENMSIETLKMIPENFINFFKTIASTSYQFNYDKNKKLIEQQLSPMTKGVLALLYRDYLCNDKEKIEYMKNYNAFLTKLEKQKSDRYNPDKIFERKNSESNNSLPTVYKKPSFINKIIQKIKKLFSINS